MRYEIQPFELLIILDTVSYHYIRQFQDDEGNNRGIYNNYHYANCLGPELTHNVQLFLAAENTECVASKNRRPAAKKKRPGG